ncbi:hypothetical protein Tco_1087774 [Tanacetum coccineum]
MDHVMTEDEAQDILDECYALHAWMDPTIEPEDEFEVLNQRLVRYKYDWELCREYGVRIIELVSNEGYCIAEFIPTNKSVTSSKHSDNLRVSQFVKAHRFYVFIFVRIELFEVLCWDNLTISFAGTK